VKEPVPRRPFWPARLLAGLVLWGGFALWCPGKSSSGALVREIRFQGNKVFTTRSLLGRIRTKPGMEYSGKVWSADLDSLRAFYRDEGFWEATLADSVRPEGDRVSLGVRVAEGPRAVLGKVVLLGTRALDERTFLSLSGLRAGRPFRKTDFEQGIERVLERYEELGHPLCRIEPGDFERRESRLDFVLRLREGPKVAIDSIQVRGNDETQARVVAREFRMKPGETYRRSKIREGRERLLATGYFLDVLEPEVIPYAGQDSFRLVWRAKLRVHVKEGRPNSAEGVMGYVPREGEKGYLTGFLRAAFRNLLGTGREVGLRWERLVPASSLLFFSYQEPYAFSLPLTLGGEVTHEVRDSSYIRTSGSAFARIPLTGEAGLILGFGRERVVPGSRLANPNRRSDKSLSIFGLAYRRLDLPLNPRAGLDLSGNAEYGIKTFPDRVDHATVTRTAGDASFHVPLGRGGEGSGFSLAILAHGRATISTEEFIPPNEEYFLGGANSLRGYAEQQFLGSRVAWANLELRRLLSRSSRIAAFYDLGTYAEKRMNPLLPDSTERVRGTKQGYGLGLRVGNETSLLKLDYALGKGERFEQGKIHVGVENRF